MKPKLLAFASFGLALSLGGCAQQMLATTNGHGGHEYFPQGKYGTASPRVIAGGPVPKGGGQYLVGRPYHVNGRTYVPTENDNYAATGIASWYGDAFHGRRTANGEIYDMAAITAAHPTMPLPSYARVTNIGNGRSIIVRVNDRGPYAPGRVMDVSSRVADLLDIKGAGTAHVHIEYVGKAPIEGSDDTHARLDPADRWQSGAARRRRRIDAGLADAAARRAGAGARSAAARAGAQGRPVHAAAPRTPPRRWPRRRPTTTSRTLRPRPSWSR